MSNVVPISDEFDERAGRWFNYNARSTPSLYGLLGQKHVDIRSFVQTAQLTERRMLDLDQVAISTLNTFRMKDLSGSYAYHNGESWTSGVVGKQADRRNWNGMVLNCPPGTTVTDSVFANPYGDKVAIDIETDFDDNDFLSVAMPAFPLASVNQATSSITLTSNPDGNFTTGPSKTIPFSATTIPLVDGNSEFRVPFSAIDTVDRQSITGIRFTIVATAQCDWRALAVRALGASWQYTQYDFDTRLEILKSTVAPDGSSTRAYDFPFPAMYRAGEPAGTGDPRPINISTAVVFYTGSGSGTNRFSFFFREADGDFTQQVDLNGKAQSELNNKPQPNLTMELSYGLRTQTELDHYQQAQLADDTQFEIERTIDPTILSFLQVNVAWTGSSTSIDLVDSEGVGHSFYDLPTMIANRPYIFIADVQDSSVRGRIYPLDYAGNILVKSQIADTGVVNDPFHFPRRAGRFGWQAQFVDGDAYIESVRTRAQTYAELTTQPLESLTAVEGAEVQAIGTEPFHYFEDLFIADLVQPNITLARDTDRQTSGESWRIDNPGTVSLQGVQTNLMDFNDFGETEITFDIYYPESNVELEAFLTDDKGRIIPLPTPTILPNRWQSVRLTANSITAQTGRYRLLVVQPSTGQASSWWIDNIKVQERILSFYGRSKLEDPWHDADIDWVPFKSTVNSKTSGVQFNERGKHLQVLAKAHSMAARINSIHVVPRYAHLGRFVWEEDELYQPQRPVAEFTMTTGSPSAPIARNFVPNPSAEVNTVGWATAESSGVTGASLARSLTWTWAGNASFRVSGTNANDTTVRRIAAIGTPTGTSGIPVLVGTTYTTSATVNIIDSGSLGARAVMLWYKSDGSASTITPSSDGGYMGAGAAGIYSISISALPPTDAAYVAVRLEVNSGVALDFVDAHFDAIIVSEEPEPITYFDGDSDYADWTGVAHNSESVLYDQQQYVERIRTVSFNGSASYDVDGEIIHHEWNFGNGASAFGPVTTYTYPNFGTYNPTLTVTDSHGLQSRKTLELELTNV